MTYTKKGTAYKYRLPVEQRVTLYNREQIAELRRQFSYDPESGIITNRSTGYAYYAQKRKYISIRTCFGKIDAHRLAWLLYYGSNPAHVIDHINHDTHDNSIFNLRDITDAENTRKRICKHRNGNLPQGIYLYTNLRKKYSTKVNRKNYYFKTIADALAFRRAHGMYVED